MASRNGLFPVLGFTRGWEWGTFLCHGQKNKKKIIKVFQSCLPTLPAYFPFETSFFGNLGASKVHQRTISPENTKTCRPDKILKNYGGDAVFNKKNPLYWSIY
jgi:hypothetical protein